MPDERVVERYFERAMEGLGALAQQVGRLAYALEQQVIMSISIDDLNLVDPCPACGCRLLTKQTKDCPACRTHVRENG